MSMFDVKADKPSVWDKEIILAQKHFNSLGHLEAVAQRKFRGTLTKEDKVILKTLQNEAKTITW
ncbi:hypothetical protein BH09PAT1_BH09PAT1_2780 [soil metagenome]